MPRLTTRMQELGWEDHLGRTNTLVALTLLGRAPIKVQAELVEAVSAMEFTLIHHGYENPCDWIGSYYYRTISGLPNVWSDHALGAAIDLDYGGDVDGDGDPTIDKNPHLHRKIVPGDAGFGVEFQLLEAQVNAIERITNTHGEQIWLWKGWSIGDTMHFGADVAPDRCEVDWDSVGFAPPTSWAAGDWRWALGAKIVSKQYSDPHSTVTKQEMAAFLRRTVRHINNGGKS